MTRIYIYALYDPDDGAIRYVGRTAEPEKRLWEHVHTRGRSTWDWIESLVVKDSAPRMRILEIVTSGSGRIAENYWIWKHWYAGAQLLNSQRGNYREDYIPECLPEHTKLEYVSESEGKKARKLKESETQYADIETRLWKTILEYSAKPQIIFGGNFDISRLSEDHRRRLDEMHALSHKYAKKYDDEFQRKVRLEEQRRAPRGQ